MYCAINWRNKRIATCQCIAELDTGRVHPRIGSGRDVSGSGRVQILGKSGGSGRVGSDYSKCIKLSIRTGRLTADLQQEAAAAISLSPSVRQATGPDRPVTTSDNWPSCRARASPWRHDMLLICK